MPDENPAPSEAMRQAAALMRDRAEAAISAPNSPEPVVVPLGSPAQPVFGHHLSWRPPVALAVADWLESTANDVEHVHTPVYNLTSTTVARALAVARRYLGESA